MKIQIEYMEKMFDLDKNSYVAASLPPKRAISEQISIGLQILFDCLKVLILAIIYSFESFYHIFVAKPKKNVAGQVALVLTLLITKSFHSKNYKKNLIYLIEDNRWRKWHWQTNSTSFGTRGMQNSNY